MTSFTCLEPWCWPFTVLSIWASPLSSQPYASSHRMGELSKGQGKNVSSLEARALELTQPHSQHLLLAKSRLRMSPTLKSRQVNAASHWWEMQNITAMLWGLSRSGCLCTRRLGQSRSSSFSDGFGFLSKSSPVAGHRRTASQCQGPVCRCSLRSISIHLPCREIFTTSTQQPRQRPAKDRCWSHPGLGPARLVPCFVNICVWGQDLSVKYLLFARRSILL
uniref:Uncharacterized protein n=1 Tax=Sus scrofa TaxID=9823 RepID=A0A480J5Q5_PIG